MNRIFVVRIIVAAACIVTITLGACGRGKPAAVSTPRIESLPSPAGAGSAQPFLASRDDKVWMSWLERGGPQVAFRYAVLADNTWSNARTITSGTDILANWADVPSILPRAGGACAVHWAGTRPDHPHACDVRVAVADSSGQWSQAVKPHADTLAVEHNFVSLIEWAPSTNERDFTCVWLDGREYAGKEEGAPGAQTQLRVSTWSDAASRFGDETVLDPRACDCCPTAAVRTASGLLVAYRDRGDDETRDISLVRCDASGTWTAPYPLARDGWRIPGCPVNGPALASAGDDVVAAWFTLRADTAIVQIAFSHDGGATFATSARIDDGSPEGRPDVALLADGSALVVWIETSLTGDAAIRARRVQPDGKLDPSFLVTTTRADRASGYPRVVRSGDEVYFAWTEVGPRMQARVARLRVSPHARKG